MEMELNALMTDEELGRDMKGNDIVGSWTYIPHICVGNPRVGS
jgi:hypothetical protein